MNKYGWLLVPFSNAWVLALLALGRRSSTMDFVDAFERAAITIIAMFIVYCFWPQRKMLRERAKSSMVCLDLAWAFARAMGSGHEVSEEIAKASREVGICCLLLVCLTDYLANYSGDISCVLYQWLEKCSYTTIPLLSLTLVSLLRLRRGKRAKASSCNLTGNESISRSPC